MVGAAAYCAAGVVTSAMRRLFSAVLGLLLFSSVGGVRADYPASGGGVEYGADGLGWFSTVADACVAGCTYQHLWTTGGNQCAAYTGGNCYGNTVGGGSNVQYWHADTRNVPYTCPNGGTLSGTTCIKTCPQGQSQNPDGTCQITCPAAGSSAMVGGAAAWKIPGTSGNCVSGFSYSGCAVTCTSGASSGGTAACTGCSFTGMPAEQTAASGTPVPQSEKDKPTTPDGCLAQGKGFVTSSSGVTTCINGADAPASQPVQTTEKTSGTATNEQGQTTSKSGTKTTECAGGNCKETQVNDTGTGQTTETTDKPTSTFCSDNPNSPMCKESKDPCEDNPDRVGCMEKGEPADGDDLPKEDRGVTSITVQSFGSSANCPSDVTLPKGATLSYAYPCQMATSLRPIILAIAWLIAGFIVVGAARDG